MVKYIPLILFTVFSNFLSQIMLKKGMSESVNSSDFEGGLANLLFSALFNIWVISGLIVMCISMASHLIVLSKVEISFAYPFLGLSFALITLYGALVLNETVNTYRIAGVALICLGVVLVSRSA